MTRTTISDYKKRYRYVVNIKVPLLVGDILFHCALFVEENYGQGNIDHNQQHLLFA